MSSGRGGWSEADWEQAAVDTLGELGWQPVKGAQLGPGSGERKDWAEPILVERLRDAISQINPDLPASAVDDAVGVVLASESRDAIAENHRLHEFMARGMRSVTVVDEYGAEHTPTIWLIDFRDPEVNDYVVASQVRIDDRNRNGIRCDLVLYLNGLPVAVVELKNAGAEKGDLRVAHQKLMNYVAEWPLAFRATVLFAVADGVTARYGTPFTPFNHFAPWNVDEKGQPVRREGNPGGQPRDVDDVRYDDAQSVLLHGLFDQRRFLELLRGYVTFASVGGSGLRKRIAKAHQYFAVSRAVEKTVEAIRGDGKAGVVWHTQGSGKSMEMELYAYQASVDPRLANPTILVLTDRIDLDDQLHGVFNASLLLPSKPVRIDSRETLRTELSSRTTGGILFTTLQKFGLTKEEREAKSAHPLLSNRLNIIVIVDEAHRSHYDNLDGFALRLREALPKATFLAFTGTPLSEVDRDTRKVFGDYIDTYDLTRAVEDGATVRVYHESRLIPLELPPGVDPETIDTRADEITAGLDEAEQERVRRSVAAMNALYGAPARVRTLASDIVKHWEARSDRMRPFIDGPGKGMIVCATRQICADLYREIVELRPGWHDDAVDRGKIKVVYTGNTDDKGEIFKHVRRPSQNKVIQSRVRDADDPLELVIVQSMLLTGFDAPPLHTMYLDRPMRGAALMQAIARVNRTHRNKRDGLLVAYAPVADRLRAALAEYTSTDQAQQPLGRDIGEMIGKVRDLHDVIVRILTDHDWRAALAAGTRTAYKDALYGTIEYLHDPARPGNTARDGQLPRAARFRDAAARLERAYALCAVRDELDDLRPDIAFFHAVRVSMAKLDAEERRAAGLPVPDEVEILLRQLTAATIEAGGVTDLYEAAGISRPPDLSHLDEAYLERLRASKTPNLAIEALRRAVEQTMRQVTRHNIVRRRSFSDRLVELMNAYRNQHLTAAEILTKLAEMAREVNTEGDRGRRFTPPLSTDELAFYDAVAQNASAVRELGDDKLAAIARDLVVQVRKSVTIDWTIREDVRARMRTIIKRLLARHGYPPDAAREAIDLVIAQTETFAEDWAAGTDR
ncbi:type I restriction endonuclease subunit R [Frankia sp. CiP1_Cm_nod2]|uniref:type I restriction endonuclease subunit R n=1 Tax=Frankia sp. CiP1_Cm_nod2 TaxID=2897161 RepID=UPI00202427CF